MNVNYETVKQDIIKKIEGKELPPNSPIMTRKELKDKYKVAVATVDRAILELKNEGYLYGIQGKGTFVAEKSKANKKIGIVFCSISHTEHHLGPYYLKILELLQRHTAGTNVSTSIFMPDKNMDSKTLKTYLSASESDIYIIFALESMETLHAFMGFDKPFIVVNPRINIPDGIPVVKEDSRQIIFELGTYFVRKNYRKVAYVWPEPDKQIFRDRGEWLERFCIDNGILFDSKLSRSLSAENEAVDAFLNEYLSSDSKPDAMIFSRGSLASMVYGRMKKMNVKIPENINLFTISDKNIAAPETGVFTRVEIDEAVFAEKIFSAYGQIANNNSSHPLNIYVQGKFVKGITG